MPDAHANFGYSTVVTAPTPALSGTSLIVQAAEGTLFPTPPFQVTIWPALVIPLVTNAEIARCTNKVGDTLTLTRAQEGTAARAILVGDQIAVTITKKVITDIEDSVATDVAALAAHLADTADAHDASAISLADAGGDFAAGDVEGALAELQTDAEADTIALSDHVADPTAAHAATAIGFTPAGTIVAADAQAAIEEVAIEVVSGSAAAAAALAAHAVDTTAIHGITDTSELQLRLAKEGDLTDADLVAMGAVPADGAAGVNTTEDLLAYRSGGEWFGLTPAAQVPDYVIVATAGTSYAVSRTGAIVGKSSSRDSAAVMTSALAALQTGAGNAAGSIALGPQAHDWKTTPALPRVASGTTPDPKLLSIRGTGGAKVTLSASAPRFLDFGRVADYDWFGNTVLSDLIIDANGVGGSGHVVLGVYTAAWPTPAQRISIENVDIRRVQVVNAPTNADLSTAHRVGIYLASYHSNVNEATRTYVRNVHVEDFKMDGNGNAGILVGGYGPAGGVNVLVDNVTLERVRHSCARAVATSGTALPAATLTVDSTAGFSTAGQLRGFNSAGAEVIITYTGKTATSFTGCSGGTGTLTVGSGLGYPTTSNFQVGGRAIGGRCSVRGMYGAASGDNGFEINAMTSAVIEDAEFENCLLGSYHENYQVPLNPATQQIVYERCGMRRTDPSLSASAFQVGPQSIAPLKKIVYRDCWLDVTADQHFSSGGAALHVVSGSDADEIVVDGFKVKHVTAATLTASRSPSWFWIRSDITSRVTLRDLDFVISGAVTTGGFSATSRALNLDGSDLILDVDGLTYDFNVSGLTSNSTRIAIFGAEASVVRGVVRRLIVKRLSGDASPRALRFTSLLTLDANHTIVFEDCDFSKMTAGLEYLHDGDPTKPFVIFNPGTRWFGNPRVATSITVTGSPFAYRNLDGWWQMVVVRAGVVSQIEYSVNGSTWVDLGVLAGAFRVRPADYLRVTYASAPTMTKVPA